MVGERSVALHSGAHVQRVPIAPAEVLPVVLLWIVEEEGRLDVLLSDARVLLPQQRAPLVVLHLAHVLLVLGEPPPNPTTTATFSGLLLLLLLLLVLALAYFPVVVLGVVGGRSLRL